MSHNSLHTPDRKVTESKGNIDVHNVALQDKDMVSALLEMKVQLDTVLTQAFQKNEQFSNALKEAFEKFINQRQNK